MSTCYKPMIAHRDENGNIVFTGSGISELRLPCGQCIGCRLNKAEAWAVRMVHEASCHDKNSFITLTYDNEHLPTNGSLDYSHPKDFIKRLRRQLDKTKEKIKFYRVGEYGDQFSRPHYHLIIFGYDFRSKIRYKGEENLHQLHRVNNDQRHYTSTMLTKLWGKGHAEISDVNYATCLYAARYVVKKINGARAASHYERVSSEGELVQIEPEKASMSRREAIGKKWLQEYYSDVYPDDSVVIDGKRLKTPAYYDKWLKDHRPALFDEVKSGREEFAQQIHDDELSVKHEVHARRQCQHASEINGHTKINQIDNEIINYTKAQRRRNHFFQKEKK